MRNLFQHFNTSICKSVKVFIVLLFITCHSFGENYEPGSITGKYQTRILGEVYHTIKGLDNRYRYWLETILSTEFLGTKKNVFQSCIPSTYVDNSGSLHTLFMNGMCYSGPHYVYKKCTFNNNGDVETDSSIGIEPWSLMGSYSLTEKPKFWESDDSSQFKNNIHNIFNPCIAQNVGADSEYLNAFCYVSPTRYHGEIFDTEGILWFDIKKSDGTISKKGFYPGYKYQPFRFYHQKPRRSNDGSSNDEYFFYQPEIGNYQAWEYGDNVHLNLIAIETELDFDTSGMYQLYNGTVAMFEDSNTSNSGGRSICPRIVKYDDSIFMLISSNGRPSILKYSSTDLSCNTFLSWSASNEKVKSPFLYLDHLSVQNYYTARDYDFCIVNNPDNPSEPIFCVLGLRPTSSTEKSKTSLNWDENSVNWGTSDIVLILSSYAWNPEKTSLVDQDYVKEDPQNIIYTTGQTCSKKSSCTVDCDCSSDKNDVEYHEDCDCSSDKNDVEYHEEQLFKNTHKICTYTSSLGNKYLIYCYCYPGKSKQLYLGYASYWVSKNKVHLGTKFEFKASPDQWSDSLSDFKWSDSFGDFIECTRIVSLDCKKDLNKKDHIWITWVNDGCQDENYCMYRYFHILAEDLVGE